MMKLIEWFEKNKIIKGNIDESIKYFNNPKKLGNKKLNDKEQEILHAFSFGCFVMQKIFFEEIKKCDIKLIAKMGGGGK